MADELGETLRRDRREGGETVTDTYGTSTLKRIRRTKSELGALRLALCEIVESAWPMSVRQVFYQAVVHYLVEKTEKAYRLVQRNLVTLRESGDIPWEWITDSTRYYRKPNTHRGLAHLLRESQEFYRRDLWANQDAHVEIWIEKEALVGVVDPVTMEYDVPLFPSRGYSSLSFIHQAAMMIEEANKPTYIYQFGDHDPSGADIPRATEASLRQMTSAPFHFERIAVTPEQVEEYSLPTRPTKKTDSRAKDFVGESVELDAIPPDVLRNLVRECIEQHMDPDVLQNARSVEETERGTLAEVIENLEADGWV